MVHISLLKPTRSHQDVVGNALLNDVDETGTYALQPLAMLGYRIHKNQKQCLIQWIGGIGEFASWENCA